jgi:quercetin dioxygenase-like cupin family protein
MRARLSVVLIVVAVTVASSAEQPAVTKYDLAATRMIEVNVNLRLMKVMGAIGTFAVGEFSPGVKSTPHHHTHEQINVGISGNTGIVVGAATHTVSRLRGLIIPADVTHGNDVPAGATAPKFIEFQPVRRVDFPPEREKVTFPIASAALPVPNGWQLDLDFTGEASGWRSFPNRARINSRAGQLVAVSTLEIPASATELFDIERQIPGSEEFAYLMEGSLEVRADGRVLQAAPESLLVNRQNAPPLQVRSSGKSSAILLVFEAATKRR